MAKLKEVCAEYGLNYVTSGPNVSRNAVGITCPFCGDDPSHHMNLTIDDPARYGWWYCFRCQEGGRAPHRLFMTALNWTFSKACEVFGHPSSHQLSGEVSEFESIANNLASLFSLETKTSAKNFITLGDHPGLTLPKEFQRLWDKKAVLRDRFLCYLISRKFTEADAQRVARLYKLHFATSGDQKNRLIFPLLSNGCIVCWTGRTVDQHTIRYKTLRTDASILTPSDIVYRYDAIKRSGGDTLVIVEGPMDAIKVDWYGRGFGVRATCLFTKTASEQQLQILADLKSEFKHIVVLFDQGAEAEAMNLISELRPIDRKAALGSLEPLGVDDPGDLQPWGVKRLIKKKFYA